jgi:FkbM family methyltransferase
MKSHHQAVSRLRQQLGLWRSRLMYYGPRAPRRRLATFYAQFIKSGDLCFDIGAHIGNRVQAWRRLDARVVAVEPQPQCMTLLHRWFGMDPQVILLEMAVGAQLGQAELYISELTPTLSTMSVTWRDSITQAQGFGDTRWQQSQLVPVTTLDAMITEYGMPAFCKIDVEGSELAVLQGLSQPIAALSFECIPAARALSLACLERLHALGNYEFNWSWGEDAQLAYQDWCRYPDIAAQVRALAQPRSGDIYARLMSA